MVPIKGLSVKVAMNGKEVVLVVVVADADVGVVEVVTFAGGGGDDDGVVVECWERVAGTVGGGGMLASRRPVERPKLLSSNP